MAETLQVRLKRLTMRSRRRSIKEMDLILGAYARDRLSGMDEDALLLYDALLSENDLDLYRWVTGQATPPARFSTLIGDITTHAKAIRSAKPARLTEHPGFRRYVCPRGSEWRGT